MSRRRKRSRPAQPRQAQAQDAYINTLNRTGLAQPNWMNAIAYPETRTTQMYQLWNGLYRDSWIPAAREILTKAMSLFSPAVLIHDAQYTESNGSREDFEETVRCWTVNTRKIFDAEFPLWTLKMLKRTYRVERAYWWGVMKTSNAAIATETAFEAYQAAARQ